MKKVAIIENTFLLQAGLSAVVQDVTGLMVEKVFSGDEPNLLAALRKHKPDVVLINPHALSPENSHLPRRLRNTDKMKLMALIRRTERDKFAGTFHDLLFFDEDKFELERKLRKYTGNHQHDEASKQLSPREITVLKMIVQGYTHQQIADKLFLSIHTVNTHRKNINKKLGIKTVSGLSLYAIMNHLIEVEELA